MNMKRLLLVGAAAFALSAAVASEAYAQRGGRGGVAVGGGMGRGMAIGAGGFRGVGYGGGGYGIRRAGIGPGYAMRGGAWRPGWGVGRPGWRPGWGVGWRPGWRWPVAAGLVAAGAWGYGGYPSYNSCLAWTGYGWVNVCYQPYGFYGYDSYGY